MSSKKKKKVVADDVSDDMMISTTSYTFDSVPATMTISSIGLAGSSSGSGQTWTAPVGSVTATYGGSSIGGMINTGTFSLPSSPLLPCQHVTSEENIEYIDGLVYSNCVHCGNRIQISRVPTGISLSATKYLVALAMDGISDNVLTMLGDACRQLEANREALLEFESLIFLVKEMVKSE